MSAISAWAHKGANTQLDPRCLREEEREGGGPRPGEFRVVARPISIVQFQSDQSLRRPMTDRPVNQMLQIRVCGYARTASVDEDDRVCDQTPRSSSRDQQREDSPELRHAVPRAHWHTICALRLDQESSLTHKIKKNCQTAYIMSQMSSSGCITGVGLCFSSCFTTTAPTRQVTFSVDFSSSFCDTGSFDSATLSS